MAHVANMDILDLAGWSQPVTRPSEAGSGYSKPDVFIDSRRFDSWSSTRTAAPNGHPVTVGGSIKANVKALIKTAAIKAAVTLSN